MLTLYQNQLSMPNISFPLVLVHVTISLYKDDKPCPNGKLKLLWHHCTYSNGTPFDVFYRIFHWVQGIPPISIYLYQTRVIWDLPCGFCGFWWVFVVFKHLPSKEGKKGAFSKALPQSVGHREWMVWWWYTIGIPFPIAFVVTKSKGHTVVTNTLS
jgi:hypothetical protein